MSVWFIPHKESVFSQNLYLNTEIEETSTKFNEIAVILGHSSIYGVLEYTSWPFAHARNCFQKNLKVQSCKSCIFRLFNCTS